MEIAPTTKTTTRFQARRRLFELIAQQEEQTSEGDWMSTFQPRSISWSYVGVAA